MSDRNVTSASLTRRATLKGAGVAVGTLWVAPMIQVISMDSAAAASAPPSRVQADPGRASGGTVSASAGSDSAVAAGSSLPKTGSESSVGMTAVGLGAVAVGGAAVYAAKHRRGANATRDNEGSADA